MPVVPNRRPQLEILSTSASHEEAAAVVAAIERFLRDHAPAIQEAEEPESGWVHAARVEAVEREPALGPWGM